MTRTSFGLFDAARRYTFLFGPGELCASGKLLLADPLGKASCPGAGGVLRFKVEHKKTCTVWGKKEHDANIFRLLVPENDQAGESNALDFPVTLTDTQVYKPSRPSIINSERESKRQVGHKGITGSRHTML